MVRNYSNTVSNSITLNSTANVSQTTIEVSDGSSFPASEFTVRVADEVMLVTDLSGGNSTSLTVERGYDGTTPVVHPVGRNVYHAVIAEDFGVVPQWMTNLAKRIDSTPHADDDEFDDGTLDAAWTSVTPSGTVNLTETQDVLAGQMVSQTSNDCCAIVKPIASGTNVKIDIAWRGFSDGGNYLMLGPVYSVGTTTTSNVIWQMSFWTGAVTHDIRSGTFTNISVDHNAPGGGNGYSLPFSHYYQRFEYDSTSGFKQYFSPDGINYSSFGAGYVTNPLGSAPTHMGIGFSTWNGSTDKLFSIEYFRVTAT